MNVAIITGASSGMGRDFVFQMQNYTDIDEFWIIARRESNLIKIKESIKKPCKVIALDLSKLEDLNKYSELLSQEKPNVTYLVNAAGYGKYGSYKQVDTLTAFNMIDLNVKALVYITQNTIPFMAENGRIIQLGSASTYNPLPNMNVYASTKVFVKHYSRALNYELKNKKIRVTTVCPGWVRTEFFDRASIDVDSKNTFAKPMVKSEKVVAKALKDARKGKELSHYGLYNKLHRILSEILPKRILISIWMNMQKKKGAFNEYS